MRISDWSSDVCSSDLYECAHRSAPTQIKTHALTRPHPDVLTLVGGRFEFPVLHSGDGDIVEHAGRLCFEYLHLFHLPGRADQHTEQHITGDALRLGAGRVHHWCLQDRPWRLIDAVVGHHHITAVTEQTLAQVEFGTVECRQTEIEPGQRRIQPKQWRRSGTGLAFWWLGFEIGRASCRERVCQSV